MKLKLMVEPSYWLGTGVRLEQVNGLKLFKFTDQLQACSDRLLERSKAGIITPEEKAELDGISELAQILTYANSALATELQWSPTQSENLSLNEPNSTVNIATRQNS